MKPKVKMIIIVIVLILYVVGYIYWRNTYVGREDKYVYTYFDENKILYHGPLMLIWIPMGAIDRMASGRGYEMRDIKIGPNWDRMRMHYPNKVP